MILRVTVPFNGDLPSSLAPEAEFIDGYVADMYRTEFVFQTYRFASTLDYSHCRCCCRHARTDHPDCMTRLHTLTVRCASDSISVILTYSHPILCTACPLPLAEDRDYFDVITVPRDAATHS